MKIVEHGIVRQLSTTTSLNSSVKPRQNMAAHMHRDKTLRKKLLTIDACSGVNRHSFFFSLSLSKYLQFNAVNQNNKSSLATNKGKNNNKIKLSTASDQSKTNNNRNISILVSGVKAASLFTESNTG